MAEISLTFTVTGDKEIDEDLKAVQLELRQKMIKGLPNVRNDMLDSLEKHLLSDVYRAYRPKEYPRRKDHPEFGPSLIDFTTKGQVRNIGNISEDGTWAEVGFDYLPDGSHSGTTADLDPTSAYYDADHPRKLKPNPVHRNELIRRIESGKGYDWKRHPGKRPFWQNFVNEMVDDGMLEYFFAKAMREQGEDVVEDGSLFRESTDGSY